MRRGHQVLVFAAPALSKGIIVMEGGAMTGAAKGTYAATTVDGETKTS